MSPEKPRAGQFAISNSNLFVRSQSILTDLLLLILILFMFIYASIDMANNDVTAPQRIGLLVEGKGVFM